MKHSALNEEQVQALWNTAEKAGIPRRKFLILLSAGSAAAVLASCAPQITPTTPTATTPTPPPTPTTTIPPINKPLPGQYFIPLGTNAEMRFEVMANRTYNMPNSFFFVRLHTSSPFPPTDVKTWSLSIEGDGVANPLKLTYDDLLAMPGVTVTRYVECAGNGRSFYSSLMNNPAQGGQWHLGAYGIAEWMGVKLSDILNRAGIKASAVDVMPAGFDSLQVRRPMSAAKAMEPDTIVAYMMNGDILPLDHGFPARMVVPGWVGINSIKWLSKITVSTTPQFSDFNTKSYVLVGPDYQPQGQALGPPVNDLVMKSALCLPFPATMNAGRQNVVGYAWSPFGKITKVDVSLDGGGTFQPATLAGPNIERAGSRWEFSFEASPGNMTITPRATDDKGNVQFPVSQQKWNQQGYIFGAMVPHPVTVK
ncbi:MAG: sulfite oxidase [Chloroflexota bacterium]